MNGEAGVLLYNHYGSRNKKRRNRPKPIPPFLTPGLSPHAGAIWSRQIIKSIANGTHASVARAMMLIRRARGVTSPPRSPGSSHRRCH